MTPRTHQQHTTSYFTCNPQVKLLEASGFDSNDFDKPVAQVACVARTWELDLIPEAAPS
jgi:hypothetical protein